MRFHIVLFVWTNLFYTIICDAEVRIRQSNIEDIINWKSEEGCCKYEIEENTACSEQCIFTFRTCINQVERISCSTVNSTEELKIKVPGSLKPPFDLTLELRANGRLVDVYQSDIVSGQWIHVKDLALKDLKSTRRKSLSPSGLRIDVSIVCGRHFYGKDCSVQCIDADDCSGHYTCNQETGKKICRTGWTGRDCTENLEGHLTCPDSVVCENGGTCILSSAAQSEKDFYICCPNRLQVNKANISNALTKQSRRKTKNIYPCPRNKCRNFGECVEGKCVCKMEFQGELCQIDTTEIKIVRPDNCPSCTFNNSCVSKSLLPLNVTTNTNCPENMYGMKCEKRCVPKNSCGDGHYTCDKATGDKICLNGWGGPGCTIRNISKECDSECPKTSCKNDGVCFNGSCCCKEGLYTGKYCETEILMCDENPCQNNAKCFNIQNDYTCECRNGYSGRNCENNLNPTSHKSTLPTTSPTTESTTPKQTPSTTLYEDSTTRALTTTSSTTVSPTYLKIVTTEPTSVVSTTTVLPTTSSSSSISSLSGLDLSPTTSMFASSTPSTSSAKSPESPTLSTTTTTTTTFKQRTTSVSPRVEPTTNSISTSARLHSVSMSRTSQTPQNTNSLVKATDNLSSGVDISKLSPTTTVSAILQTTTEQSIPVFQVYISGNIDNKDKDELEQLINQSLTVCTSQNTEIVDMRHLISDNGVQVTNVSYVVHGCSNLTDPFKDSNSTMRLNQLLQSSETFQHNRLYGSNTDELKDISFSYYVDLIGYVYSNNLKTIKDTLISAWAIANPDIPEVDILVILRDYYLGDYGIYVRKLSYFVTSKGKLLSPSSIKSPSLLELQNKFNGKDSLLNKLYTGRMLILYKNGLRLNIRNGEMSKPKLHNSLNRAWSPYIKTNLGEGNKSVNFIVSKREPCSYLKKTNVYSVIYAPVWSTGMQVEISPPPVLSTAEFTLCNCQPKRQFYVDILGRVKLRDRASVEAHIAKTWERVKVASKMNDEETKYTRLTALRTAERKPVTRLWFIQPDKSHDDTDSWPNPNMGNRLAGIEKNLASINRSISYVRSEKWYHLVLGGDQKNNKEEKIKQYLITSWVEQNTEISKQDVRIRIMDWSSKYSCSQSKTITLVQYTVSVFNANSIETSLEEPNEKVYDKTFSQSGVAILHCTPRYQREFGLLGIFGQENKTDLENAIQNTWIQLNNGLPVNITAHITKLSSGFTSETGDKATKVQYYIDVRKNDEDVDEDDIDKPDKSKLQQEIKSRFPGIAILSLLLTESISPVKEEKNTKSWIYPLIVVACVLVVVAFVSALFGFVRYQRHRDSKTLTQDPEEVDEYDKEHFSEEPEMDNSSFSLEETMDDQQNHKTYIVN